MNEFDYIKQLELQLTELQRENTVLTERLEEDKKVKELFSNAEKIADFGSYRWNIVTNEIIWSNGHYRILGVDKETFTPSLSTFMEFVHPDDHEKVRDALENMIKINSAEPQNFEFRFIDKSGQEGYIQSTSSLTKWDSAGNATEMVGTALNITTQVENRLKIKQIQEELSKSQQIANLGSWELDLETQIITLSKEHQILIDEDPVRVSIPLQEYAKKHIFSKDIPFIQERLAFAMQNSDNVNYQDYFEYRTMRGDGEYEYFDVNSNFKSKGIIYGITQKITERKEIERELWFLAHHDPLTQLPNRLMLQEKLDHVLAHVHRRKDKIAVLFIDIDHFKDINDSLGHHYGDHLLKTIAKRLTALLRKEDTVARISGDEFIIVLEELKKNQSVAEIAEKILIEMRRPMVLEPHEVTVSVSIGIAMSPDNGYDTITLFKNADIALYKAKENGRNTFEFFSKDMVTTGI